MRFINRLPASNHNLSKATPLGNFLKSLVGSLAVLAVLYFGSVWTINLIVPHVSIETEAWLVGVFMPRYEYTKRTPLERDLQVRLARLAASDPGLPYRPVVHVETSDEINAYALPGGNIVMLTGLLDEVESPDEIDFILGHELGHIANRDHLRGLGRALTLNGLNLLCRYAVGVDLLSDALTLYDRSVSRKQEAAADLYGLDRLHAVKGNIDGALAFFERQRSKGGMPAWAAYFSTHPKDESRIRGVKAYAGSMGYATGH